MKRTVQTHAYDWLIETKAAEDFGRLSALAYARVLRAAARQNCVQATIPKHGEKAAVLASDRDCEEWTATVPLENLISDYLRDCIEFDAPTCLDETAAMLERMAAKARRLQSQMKDK